MSTSKFKKFLTGRQRRSGKEQDPFKYGWSYDGPYQQIFRVQFDYIYDTVYQDVYEDVILDLCERLGIPTKPQEPKSGDEGSVALDVLDLFEPLRNRLYEALHEDLLADLTEDLENERPQEK